MHMAEWWVTLGKPQRSESMVKGLSRKDEEFRLYPVAPKLALFKDHLRKF